MVITKKNDRWDGFGFLGQSNTGKTPLSCAFALRLLRSSETSIKILDDCFALEEGRINQCRDWGNPDRLCYRQEMLEFLRSLGKAEEAVHPRNEKYALGKVAMWLLIPSQDVKPFRREECSRRKFAEELMNHNPFWTRPPSGIEALLERFRESWKYSIIYRESVTTRPLIDSLVEKALTEFSGLVEEP